MAHENSTSETSSFIDISDIFSASEFLNDDADIVFDNFEFASVVTGSFSNLVRTKMITSDFYLQIMDPCNGIFVMMELLLIGEMSKRVI